MDVSVIIPTHNRLDNLIKAVESVCSQTLQPREIIIVDDASKIPVKGALRNVNPKGVHIICERFSKPHGACVARNRGAELAIGDVLMFLDDDDSWEPQKIEKQIEIFKKNPKVALVYSGRKVVSENDRDKVLYTISPSKKGILYPQILYKNFIGTTSSVAIKRELFIEVGGFDENLPALQDYDLWIRCCKQFYIDHDGECNIRYTIADNPSKQISGRKSNHIKAVKILLKKYQKDIKGQGMVGKKRIYSSLYFYIAKSTRRRSYWESLIWCVKSLSHFPNIRIVTLLVPQTIIKRIRQILS